MASNTVYSRSSFPTTDVNTGITHVCIEAISLDHAHPHVFWWSLWLCRWLCLEERIPETRSCTLARSVLGKPSSNFWRGHNDWSTWYTWNWRQNAGKYICKIVLNIRLHHQRCISSRAQGTFVLQEEKLDNNCVHYLNIHRHHEDKLVVPYNPEIAVLWGGLTQHPTCEQAWVWAVLGAIDRSRQLRCSWAATKVRWYGKWSCQLNSFPLTTCWNTERSWRSWTRI